ncbi:MAG: O-acetylhomoserine (thiol)-lyase, partial [Candidatus Latescibacterota bacterium]
GVFDWTCFPNINDRYKKYETNTWGIVQIRKKGIRDFGATLSPDSANLIMLGMETLFLRMEKISENAMKLATFLSSLKEVKAVYYPGLSNHPQHNIAKRLFKRFSGLMSFELHSWVDMAEFLDGLDVFACSSNLGDNRSLMIPVAQTIFYEVGVDERVKMEISESLIRLSVGIEDIDDLCEDILSSIKKLDYI